MAAFLALAEGLSPGAIDAVLPDKPDPRLPPLSIGLLRYGRRPEPEGMVKLWTWRKGACQQSAYTGLLGGKVMIDVTVQGLGESCH